MKRTYSKDCIKKLCISLEVFAFIPDTAYPQRGSPACTMKPDLQGYFENPASLDCYRINLQAMTWPQAAAACANDGTQLATINNVYDQAYLDTILASDITAWIGLADLQVRIKTQLRYKYILKLYTVNV